MPPPHARASWKTPTARSRAGSTPRWTTSAPCSMGSSSEEGQVAQVNVTINSRQYRMACEDGQEEHLVELAKLLDERINELRGKFGEVGDTRLTVMAALTMADEMNEVAKKVQRLEQELAGAQDARAAAAA